MRPGTIRPLTSRDAWRPYGRGRWSYEAPFSVIRCIPHLSAPFRSEPHLSAHTFSVTAQAPSPNFCFPQSDHKVTQSKPIQPNLTQSNLRSIQTPGTVRRLYTSLLLPVIARPRCPVVPSPIDTHARPWTPIDFGGLHSSLLSTAAPAEWLPRIRLSNPDGIAPQSSGLLAPRDTVALGPANTTRRVGNLSGQGTSYPGKPRPNPNNPNGVAPIPHDPDQESAD
jgi:hypothetical protein